MNTNLEKIRKACIEANPEIVDADTGFKNKAGTGWQYAFTDSKGRNQHMGTIFATREEAHLAAVRSGLFDERPIRLADVLLLLEEIKGYGEECHVDSDGTISFFAFNPLCGPEPESQILKGNWNLRKDSLTDQSEETINFIAELL